jgi:voltage-gated potassium channel
METNTEKIGFFNLLIVFLSVYVIIALLMDTFFKLPIEVSNLLSLIDDFICIIFIADFSIRLYYAKNKLKFLQWGWIDLLSSIPAFPFVRFGRVFRLVRLFRVLRGFRSIRVLVNHIYRNRVKGTITSVALITVLIVIISSISILLVETDQNSNIKTAEDALWWSMVTVTTVGYGDKYPVTTEGRIIGTFLMVVGVGVFGVFTAYVASWFIEGKQNNKDS